MKPVDLGPVDRITADAIGEPGMRVFYLQVRAGERLITVIVEKQQVQLLAHSVHELLEGEPSGGEQEVRDPAAMELEEPIDPRWRAGRLSIGFDAGLGRFALEIAEWRPDPGEEASDDPRDAMEGDGEEITLEASRDQMLALASHGTDVAARGRPTCQFCGNPIDPEGHACPATNGHRKPRS